MTKNCNCSKMNIFDRIYRIKKHVNPVNPVQIMPNKKCHVE